MAVCPCGVPFDPDTNHDGTPRQFGVPRRYCSLACRRHAAYLNLKATGYYANPDLLDRNRRYVRWWKRHRREARR